MKTKKKRTKIKIKKKKKKTIQHQLWLKSEFENKKSQE
jgi:hypothetical protein